MDRISQYFLNILRAALQGRVLQEPTDLTMEEWGQLMELARCHHVLPMVFQSIYSLPELQNTPLLGMVRQQVRRSVFIQTQKTADFLDLNGRLCAAGVRPLVVKGIVCRNLYPYPDHRPSSDEDLLVPPEQLEHCHQVLTDLGMATSESLEKLDGFADIPYRSREGILYIELHRHLFSPNAEAYADLNRFFEGVFERAVTEQIQGIPVYTMGYTDHLFYLICHAFKHFLHSGFGIRQVCDIVMFASAYGSRIDWLEILEHCRLIRADRFAAAIFRIGRKHLVFDPVKAHYPPQWQDIAVDETAMLEDLLGGGIYGGVTMSRKHSSNITLDAVAAQKHGRRSANAILSSLFPSAQALQGGYPYLKQYPFLLPAAWFDRAIRYCRESGTDRDNNASEALQIGSRRVTLLKEYGIIE